METLLRDLRFSLRLLVKTPGFTAAAIAVLALGIGANTAIFSIVRELVFSPRPFPDAAQVVQLYTQDKKDPQRFRQFSYPTYRDLCEQNTVFSGLLAHNVAIVGVGEGEGSRRTFAAIVSANYFRTLGVPLAQGRDFLPAEEKPGSAVPVVIASHFYWEKTGRDPQLIGKTIRVNERPFTVVGIAPDRFTGTMMLIGPELYFPLGDFDVLTNDFSSESKRTLDRRDAYNLFLVGRLKDGVTPAGADAALKTLAANLEQALPVEQKDQTFIARPLPRLSTSTNPTGENDLALLGTLLLSMAGIVLLIASLNLATMLLARGAARRKEIAIRLALGGGRLRLIRQLLTEGFVLALAGGGAGFLLGFWSSRILAGSLSAHMPVAISIRGGTDPAVFAATLGFCALATLFFALGPALKLTRLDVLPDLKAQAGEDAAPRRRRWLPRHPLVVAQIALSLGLLTAAGLFIRGALKAGSVETGFKADDTILVEVDASLGGYDQTRSLQFYRAAIDRLAALPGVQAAGIGSIVPFGFMTINRPVQRAGVKTSPDAHPATAAEGLAFNVRWNSIGADYFAAMGLPLLRGRPFTAVEAETPDSPPVAIVDEVLARKLWPEGDALGQRIQWAEPDAPKAQGGGSGTMGASDDIAKRASDAKSLEIVGIVPTTRWELFGPADGGQIYVPFAQGFQSNTFFHVRTAPRARGGDAALFDVIRREIRTAAPGVPVFTVKSFRQHVDTNAQLWIVRVGAAMFSVFGGLALILAVVGVYGIKAYAVARRTREIGIRMALGAEPGAVLRLILREGLVMTLSGAALGFLLALGIGRAFSGLLYQISPVDPVAFTAAPAVLIGTALFACWLPARRASRVNPLVALRTE
ncbi:MAG TPA: ABC transporter permease [Opitutaceae bacterium]|nr:ABC transporter permease [Opitutaceae bacterium]